jgi:hypothetical protein
MRQLSIFLIVVIGLVPAGYAQMQVSQEPRHHTVFENEWVRVLDVHVPPHDTTLMHKHSTPSVFLILSKTKTGSETLIEPGKPSFADGNIWFEGFYDKPRIHRVWNEDTVEFHAMDIELLHAPSPTSNDKVGAAFSQSLFDEKPVHAFKITLGPNKVFKLNALESPVLVIGLSGPSAEGVVNDHAFTKKGDYLFISAGAPLGIANNSAASDEQFALLYLK